MATYIAYLSINDTDGRSKNFTATPTVTVWNGRTRAAITTPSPTLTNITTGLYSVDIELDTKTDVLFKIIPHVDDEEDIQDIKVIHEGYIETVETMGVGVTLISAYDAAKNAASQSSVEAIPTTPLLAANYTAPDNAGITSIKNKTDNLPAVPAAKSDIPSVSDIATAVWGAVTRTLTSVSLTAQGVWEYISRTLTASPTDTSNLATKNDVESGIEEVIEAIDEKPVTPPTDITNLPTKTDLATAKDAIISAMPDIDVSAIATEETLQEVKEQTDQMVFVNNRVNANATVDLDEADIAKQSSVEQILAMFSETPIEIIAQVADGKITATRGNDWAIVIPCELNETAKIQMAVKYGSGLKDSNSALFVDTESGLIYLNGESANNTDGNLAYVDGNLILTIKASATAQLKATGYRYGIQSVSQANHVEEKYQGAFIVTDDIVRATE